MLTVLLTCWSWCFILCFNICEIRDLNSFHNGNFVSATRQFIGLPFHYFPYNWFVVWFFFFNIIFYFKHNVKGKTEPRGNNPKHLQEGIFKLVLEVSLPTSIYLHRLIYVFWVFSHKFKVCGSLELKICEVYRVMSQLSVERMAMDKRLQEEAFLSLVKWKKWHHLIN